MTECIDHELAGIGEGYACVKGIVEGEDRWIGYHRLIFYQTNGYLPPVVRHTCDNPRCINPSHLLGGTHMDNVRDAVERGRIKKGSESPVSKLNEEDVRLIRDIHNKGTLSRQELAIRFKVHPKTVDLVIARKTWKHVP